MKILSLFDGISCARVALDRAGIPVEFYYASEIDKYAIQLAKKNYPSTILLNGVEHITRRVQHLLPEIDLLIGGSPCQDLSIAKKDRKGLDGERSGLFWKYARILREVKPKYFILENVNSMPKEAKDIISKELGVEPIMINASLVSAQNRKRLFWTNIPGVTLPNDKGILLRDILEPKVDETYYVKDKSNTIRTSGRGSGIDDKHNWDTIRIGEFNKGGQGDRIYSPDGKSVGLSALGGGRGAKTGLYLVNEHVRKLTPLECERLQGLPDNYTAYSKVLHIENEYSNIDTWNNVLLKIAQEKKKQISVPVLCTIKDIKDIKVLNYLKNKYPQNVDIVIDWQSQENSVTNTIRIGIGTKTHFTQIRLENITEQQLEVNMGILEMVMENGDTETLWKNISEENWEEMKSYIISTLINLIIGLKTYMSAQERNTCLFTTNLKNLLQNSLKTEQSVLMIKHTSLISNAQRYKCLGNAFNVDVVVHILSFLK